MSAPVPSTPSASPELTHWSVGSTRVVQHTVTRHEVELMAWLSGDANPFGSTQGSTQGAAQGQGEVAALIAGADLAAPIAPADPPPPQPVCEAVSAEALIHAILKRQLPGPGTVIRSHQLSFEGEVHVGDVLIATVTLVRLSSDGLSSMECQVRRGDDYLLRGVVEVQCSSPPRAADVRDPIDVGLRRSDVFGRLFRECEQREPVDCAVVHPCDEAALGGALQAARYGLIRPVLVGPRAKIEAVARAQGWDLGPFALEDAPHSHAAAELAVQMATQGRVQALMKGSLHTDELMSSVVAAHSGLRTARRISHVFVMDVPAYPRMLLITDAAINIAPDIDAKVDIVQNAIDLAHVLGVAQPKVAILAAVETVNAQMPATVDAAMLSKMAERGQIVGGVVDGPLAFDNAINQQAAQTKHIVSDVAGLADILVVPNLEAGNMVAKQLQYLAGADSAGIVLGARVPIILTSRADSVRTRLASAAVLKLLAHAMLLAS